MFLWKKKIFLFSQRLSLQFSQLSFSFFFKNTCISCASLKSPFNIFAFLSSILAPIQIIITTQPSANFNAATKSKKACGKYPTVSRYKNPKIGLDTKGSKAWKVPTIEKTFPTSSGLTFFVIKDLNQNKNCYSSISK